MTKSYDPSAAWASEYLRIEQRSALRAARLLWDSETPAPRRVHYYGYVRWRDLYELVLVDLSGSSPVTESLRQHAWSITRSLAATTRALCP